MHCNLCVIGHCPFVTDIGFIAGPLGIENLVSGTGSGRCDDDDSDGDDMMIMMIVMVMI